MCEVFKLAIDENRILLSVECGNLKRINKIVLYKKIFKKEIFFCILLSYEIYDSGIPLNVNGTFWYIIGTTHNLSIQLKKMGLPKVISLLFTWTNASELWFGALLEKAVKNHIDFKKTQCTFNICRPYLT